MFAKLFALFALLAVAFASPKPDIVYPGGVVAAYPGAAITYGAAPPLAGYPYNAAGFPYTYPYYVK